MVVLRCERGLSWKLRLCCLNNDRGSSFRRFKYWQVLIYVTSHGGSFSQHLCSLDGRCMQSWAAVTANELVAAYVDRHGRNIG